MRGFPADTPLAGPLANPCSRAQISTPETTPLQFRGSAAEGSFTRHRYQPQQAAPSLVLPLQPTANSASHPSRQKLHSVQPNNTVRPKREFLSRCFFTPASHSPEERKERCPGNSTARYRHSPCRWLHPFPQSLNQSTLGQRADEPVLVLLSARPPRVADR